METKGTLKDKYAKTLPTPVHPDLNVYLEILHNDTCAMQKTLFDNCVARQLTRDEQKSILRYHDQLDQINSWLSKLKN